MIITCSRLRLKFILIRKTFLEIFCSQHHCNRTYQCAVFATRAPTEMPRFRESIFKRKGGEEEANASEKSARDYFAGVEKKEKRKKRVRGGRRSTLKRLLDSAKET